MASVSPQIPLWGYSSTLSLRRVRCTGGKMILDDLDWGGATGTSSANYQFDAAPIGVVSYNCTADKHGLLIGGALGGEG